MKPAQPGSIYVWRYVDADRSYVGWHLSGDARGCAALIAALDALALAPDGRRRKLVTVAPPPSTLAVPGCRKPARWAHTLVLGVDRAQPRRFALAEDNGVVTLAVGEARLDELRDRVEDIPRGGGDVAMSSDDRSAADQRLWFWW